MARYHFGDFVFEPGEFRLLRDDAIVPAQPRVLEALAFFVTRSGQLVTRDTLLENLWPDTFVNEEALTQTIRKLRRALGDNPRDPAYLETVPKRGYRFKALVERLPDAPEVGPTVAVPAWLDPAPAPPPPAADRSARVHDLDHLRQLLVAGARLVIGDRFALGPRVGSTVYQGRDLLAGATVALKILHRPQAEEIVRFQREVRFLVELEHEGIVPYVAHGTTETGLCFLATRWLSGEPLGQWLADRGRLEAETFRRLARRVAETLAYAHGEGIIHRDLRPGTLMIPDDDPGGAVVLDFGLARFQWDTPVTEAGTVLGTIGYISPEQVHGRRDIDSRADVFALGCVFFEALAGQPPFQGSTLQIMRSLVTVDAPPIRTLRPDIDERTELLIAAMLSREAELRPVDGAAVLRSLASLGPA